MIITATPTVNFYALPPAPRRSKVYITGMTVDPLLRCVLCTVKPSGYTGLGPDAKGSHVDLMSQQITSNSVYVFFAMGAARHIL